MSLLNLIFYPKTDSLGIFGQLRNSLKRAYERYTFRFERFITDSFAVTARGYHNLIQYLYFLKVSDNRLLSTGSDHNTLVQHSAAIFKLTAAFEKEEKGKFYYLDITFHHLVALGQLYQPEVLSSKLERQTLQIRLLKGTMFCLPLLLAGVFFILQAVDYRPIYVDKIAREKQTLENLLKKSEKKVSTSTPPPIGVE